MERQQGNLHIGNAEMAENSFLERIKDEVIEPVFASNKACRTCIFAHGDPSWKVPEGYKIAPDKCYCQIYEPDDLGEKPDDVAFHGADCEFYEKAI
jgi:hypothetical protein